MNEERTNPNGIKVSWAISDTERPNKNGIRVREIRTTRTPLTTRTYDTDCNRPVFSSDYEVTIENLRFHRETRIVSTAKEGVNKKRLKGTQILEVFLPFCQRTVFRARFLSRSGSRQRSLDSFSFKWVSFHFITGSSFQEILCTCSIINGPSYLRLLWNIDCRSRHLDQLLQQLSRMSSRCCYPSNTFNKLRITNRDWPLTSSGVTGKLVPGLNHNNEKIVYGRYDLGCAH